MTSEQLFLVLFYLVINVYWCFSVYSIHLMSGCLVPYFITSNYGLFALL